MQRRCRQTRSTLPSPQPHTVTGFGHETTQSSNNARVDPCPIGEDDSVMRNRSDKGSRRVGPKPIREATTSTRGRRRCGRIAPGALDRNDPSTGQPVWIYSVGSTRNPTSGSPSRPAGDGDGLAEGGAGSRVGPTDDVGFDGEVCCGAGPETGACWGEPATGRGSAEVPGASGPAPRTTGGAGRYGRRAGGIVAFQYQYVSTPSRAARPAIDSARIRNGSVPSPVASWALGGSEATINACVRACAVRAITGPPDSGDGEAPMRLSRAAGNVLGNNVVGSNVVGSSVVATIVTSAVATTPRTMPVGMALAMIGPEASAPDPSAVAAMVDGDVGSLTMACDASAVTKSTTMLAVTVATTTGRRRLDDHRGDAPPDPASVRPCDGHPGCPVSEAPSVRVIKAGRTTVRRRRGGVGRGRRGARRGTAPKRTARGPTDHGCDVNRAGHQS